MSKTFKDTLAKIGDDIDNDGITGRIDALIDLLHVASFLARTLSDEHYSFSMDYLDSARTSLDQFQDKKTARQYAKDSDLLSKTESDLIKLRSKIAKKLDR